MIYPRNRGLRALPQYSTCSEWPVLALSVLTLQNILWTNRQTVKLHEIKTPNQKNLSKWKQRKTEDSVPSAKSNDLQVKPGPRASGRSERLVTAWEAASPYSSLLHSWNRFCLQFLLVLRAVALQFHGGAFLLMSVCRKRVGRMITTHPLRSLF